MRVWDFFFVQPVTANLTLCIISSIALIPDAIQWSDGSIMRGQLSAQELPRQVGLPKLTEKRFRNREGFPLLGPAPLEVGNL